MPMGINGNTNKRRRTTFDRVSYKAFQANEFDKTGTMRQLEKTTSTVYKKHVCVNRAKISESS